MPWTRALPTHHAGVFMVILISRMSVRRGCFTHSVLKWTHPPGDCFNFSFCCEHWGDKCFHLSPMWITGKLDYISEIAKFPRPLIISMGTNLSAKLALRQKILKTRNHWNINLSRAFAKQNKMLMILNKRLSQQSFCPIILRKQKIIYRLKCVSCHFLK